MKPILLKVCGMRQPDNILELAKLQPDFMGFIFYEKSPRFILEEDNLDTILNLPKTIKKTGVFVNEVFEIILTKIKEYQLDAVQLHGSESPKTCKQIKKQGVVLIKAFGVNEKFDFKTLEEYSDCVDYFLFDTKVENHGGSGKKFDWSLLKNYQLPIPFFLAGGVSTDDVGNLQLLNLTQLAGIDVNSKFEISPGIKNIEELKKIFTTIRQN